MSIKNRHISTLDYYLHPFSPNISNRNGSISSSMKLELDKELFSKKNLERIVEELNYNMIFGKNIAPIIGEILATQIIDYNISNRTEKHENTISKLIKISGKSGYNINTSEKYVAKLTNGHNVVILKKGKNKNKKKFNFIVASEIDGLYLLKRNIQSENKKRKTKKIYYPIETKTGIISISKEHIFRDIILPLREMYKTEINYIMIGFESRMYKNNKKKIFNRIIQDIYYFLNRRNVKFFPLCFPFSEISFFNFVNEINKKRIGIDVAKYAVYDKKNNYVKMVLSNGTEVVGRIVTDKEYVREFGTV